MNHGKSRWITANHGESRLFLPRARFVWANHAQSRSITFNHAQTRCFLWRVSCREDLVWHPARQSTVIQEQQGYNLPTCLLESTWCEGKSKPLTYGEIYPHLFSSESCERTPGMSTIYLFFLIATAARQMHVSFCKNLWSFLSSSNRPLPKALVAHWNKPGFRRPLASQKNSALQNTAILILFHFKESNYLALFLQYRTTSKNMCVIIYTYT